MTGRKSILLLPGDGIGPEIMRETRRVLEWLVQAFDLEIDISEGLFGGASIDVHGVPVTDELMARALAADAVLLGAVGGPRWDGVPFAIRPESALLRLRKELGVFANLRPALCLDALVDASSLKGEIVRGLDMIVVRELTGGIYFGEPRGITGLDDGQRRGINTQVYETGEIRRVARVALELARTRRRNVVSCDKANVMESGRLWREEVQYVRDTEFPDVSLTHMYADNAGMQLVRAPRQFDVLLTDNLFGDLLSDVAAMLTGSLGMLPSASLGAPAAGTGRRRAVYEPVHGSAPDIASKNIANPLGMIFSLEMCLRHSLGLHTGADLLRDAVIQVLAGGMRTADIMDSRSACVSTPIVGDAILMMLERNMRKQPPARQPEASPAGTGESQGGRDTDDA